MKHITAISDLPSRAAVYALYGGRGRSHHVAYVGITSDLRKRLTQHLLRRDSSVSTGTSAAGLNPDYVTEIRWWYRTDFRTKYIREAAELVAFKVLDPALRSRGNHQTKAVEKSMEPVFREEMTALFKGESTGGLVMPTLEDALDRITELEKRVAKVENRLARSNLVHCVSTWGAPKLDYSNCH